jgi:hypothetical protein
VHVKAGEVWIDLRALFEHALSLWNLAGTEENQPRVLQDMWVGDSGGDRFSSGIKRACRIA